VIGAATALPDMIRAMAPLPLFLLLVATPVVAGFAATYPCGARNRNGTRCRRGRKGPMERCHDHAGQGTTPSDWFWLAGCLGGFVMYLVWRAAYPGPLLETLLG